MLAMVKMGRNKMNETDYECKWLHEEVCCNSDYDECADFPSEEVCRECEHREENIDAN